MTLYMSKYQGLQTTESFGPLSRQPLTRHTEGGGAAGVAVHGAGGGRMNSFCT